MLGNIKASLKSYGKQWGGGREWGEAKGERGMISMDGKRGGGGKGGQECVVGWPTDLQNSMQLFANIVEMKRTDETKFNGPFISLQRDFCAAEL